MLVGNSSDQGANAGKQRVGAWKGGRTGSYEGLDCTPSRLRRVLSCGMRRWETRVLRVEVLEEKRANILTGSLVAGSIIIISFGTSSNDPDRNALLCSEICTFVQ